jgi:hypothetical protein
MDAERSRDRDIGGNGGNGGNGKPNGLNHRKPPVASLFSSLAGVDVETYTTSAGRTYEHARFHINSITDVLAEIRRLGKSGTLTMHVRGGRVEGVAEFKRETTDRSMDRSG